MPLTFLQLQLSLADKSIQKASTFQSLCQQIIKKASSVHLEHNQDNFTPTETIQIKEIRPHHAMKRKQKPLS